MNDGPVARNGIIFLHKAINFLWILWTLLCLFIAVVVALPNINLPGSQLVGGFSVAGVFWFWLVISGFIGFLSVLTRPKLWGREWTDAPPKNGHSAG